jgi:hypothetical protein
VGVLVEVDRLPERRVLAGRLEERALGRARGAVLAACGLDDRLRVDPLVDVERDRRHLERRVLGLAGPGRRRIEVGIVGVALRRRIPVGGLGDQADRGVVLPLLALVVVLLDGPLAAGLFCRLA